MYCPLSLKRVALVYLLLWVLLSGCRKAPDLPNDSKSMLPALAPSSSVFDLKNNPVTLSYYRGQVVLVDFWATWCPPCIEDFPELKRLHHKYQNKGFTVIGIAIDEGGANAVKPVIKKRGVTYPILLDNQKNEPLYKAFGIEMLPALFLLDAEGLILQKWTGKSDKAEVEAAIINALQQTTRKSH
jgi:thiol-disulfide isomerase/thioredoxin